MSAAAIRAEAARAVLAVLAGQSLDAALLRLRLPDPRDNAFAKTLAYGVLREHSALHWLLSRLLAKPMAATSPVHALLCVGLHQLRGLNTPAHAAVSETVNATELLGEAKARGLVNAILRRYQREAPQLEDALPQTLAIRHSHPDWLVEALHRDWRHQTAEVLTANNRQAPMTLRVNRRQTTRAAYLDQLAAAGLPAVAVPHVADAVRLASPCGVEALPGFAAGLVSVQDASAQLAAGLLAVQDGQRVLDACAAPGGKTAHLLETADLDLLALDVDAQRLARIEDNLRRLSLRALVQKADATRVPWWFKGAPFDRILLDAPCSGTGVIRRHPDIKWLRRADDIPRLAQTQLALLQALWPTLAPGGLLLYATCSTLRAEGEDVVRQFLASQPEASESVIEADWGEPCRVGRRIAPALETDFDGDGFYYARLIKTA